MELAFLGLGTVGCAIILLAFALMLAVQALFLRYGAKMTGVEEKYSKAFLAVLIVGIVNGVVQFGLSQGKSPQDLQLSWSNFVGDILVSLAATVLVGTIVVTWIYAIPVLRALLAYVVSMALTAIASLLVAVVIFGTLWAVSGSEGFDNYIQDFERTYNENLREQARREGLDPDSVVQPTVSLLDDVEFTEFENAVDITVADARKYLGKKVRVVHGPRRESIGTLKDVTSTTLIVAENIEGGRIDIPIQKSKITTFQWIPPG